MGKERITRQDIEGYKREILESTVLVRLDEVASILAVHPRTVQRRVDEGHITPYVDRGNRKHVRFLASELQRYVREMRNGGGGD
jgi:excisionase family DNA binding protein